MRELAFYFPNGIITMPLSAEFNPTASAMEEAVAVEEGQEVVKEDFKMILLDGRNRCSTVLQLEIESR